MKRTSLIALCLMAPALITGCRRPDVDTSGQVDTAAPETREASGGSGPAAGGNVEEIAAARNLSPDDVIAAMKTFVPSGRADDYVMFASGGHSGQMLVIGMPSMRLLKVIGVFTPEPWQGWGFGAAGTEAVLDGGNVRGREVRWADTHHPALSETEGDYDGQFVFINDKANARIAVVDLRDFETKQIIQNPVADIDHGGTMVTPNTEWVIEGGQYAEPLGGEYAPLDEYEAKYRGHITFWKFDRSQGRIDPARSFSMEVPPYWQDLCDAGKLVSEGWVVCNSFNSEMATGMNGDEGVPFEAGASQNDFDFLHIIDLKAATAAVDAGKTVEINGFKVLPLQTSIDEGILYFAPEPKSPHGADIAPKGDYIVVSGKLDPHVTVYSFQKIFDAIAAGEWTADPFGVPILPFDDVVEAQVEVGLGPLHTQFDNSGHGYTSLFLDSAVARWTLGPEYVTNGEEPWTLITATPVHYNVGHVAAAEGDTVSPDGTYLVSLNKWAIDRFQNVGPLLPQNLQLLDISQPGATMPVIYDMPIGIGEPHYAQIIKADKLAPWQVYPEVGWDPSAQSPAGAAAVALGDERVERTGNKVEVWMTAIRSHFTPERIELKEGDDVTLHITNVETTYDATHGFAIPVYGVNLSLEPGETETVHFTADTTGVFSYYCTEFCSALHLEMAGYMLVEPQ